MKINIFCPSSLHNPGRKEKLLWEKIALLSLGKLSRKNGETGLIFTDGRKITAINKSFLGRNRLTDVIAFNYPQPRLRSAEALPFGDVFICVTAARNQAKNLGHSLRGELRMLVAHGALHLSGMDDATPKQRDTMNKKAAKLIVRAENLF